MVGNTGVLEVGGIFPGDEEPVGVSWAGTTDCRESNSMLSCVLGDPGASGPSRRAHAKDAWKRGSS